ncbi:MAG: HTTM domain-containing protein [Microthrixaceae bacterium]
MRKIGREIDIRTAASRPVSGKSLVVFRVVFGAVVAGSAIRLLLTDWAVSLYAGPVRHFAYPGMGWVPVPSAPLMRLLIAAIALAAVLVMIGYRYRISMAILWVLFTWMEFTEATVYLNHYWFISVMGALMIFLPMNSPGSVPVGAVWMVRFQVAIVYVFAGIAKLHGDWLLHGLPMSLWLGTHSDLPVVGGVLESATTAVVLSWAGAFFDCFVVVFLLWRRTRLVAWFTVIVFHVLTWFLFPVIGVFPFLMIGASLIFFDPDWPARFARFRDRRADPVSLTGPQGASARSSGTPGPVGTPGTRRSLSRWVMAGAGLWIAFQVLFPMRQVLYSGDARWTGEGYRFSWNVLATEKAGDVVFRVTDTTSGATELTDATDLFTPQQWRTMVTDPELIRQAAHDVADEEAGTRGVPVSRLQVRVDAFVSFNGRSARRIIDPDVDLAAEPMRFGHQRWIRPVR